MSMVDTAPGKIQVRDLNFYYGKFHALKNINLDIAKNQVTAFIGPSGCGKSTLLRNVFTVQDDFAFGTLLWIERVHFVKGAQQRGFTTAGRTDECRYLVLRDIQVDILQGMEYSMP